MRIFIALFHVICSYFKEIFLFFVPKIFRLKNIEDEIVLITGGGGGLGRALAIRFAKRGAKIIVWDINQNGLNETIEAVKQNGGQCWSFICDVTKREQVYSIANKIKEEIGIVNVLVNNAGIFIGKHLLDMTDAQIMKVMEVNCISQFWTCKAFLPDMMASNHGHIVTIASIAGLTGSEMLIEYCASKFGSVGFEESLRYELYNKGYDGVKTTLVCPYFINTGLFDGVKIPSFLSILKVDNVADYVVNAMLSDTQFVLLPKIAYLLFYCKFSMPVRTFGVVLNEFLQMSNALTELKKNTVKQKQETDDQNNILESVVTKL